MRTQDQIKTKLTQLKETQKEANTQELKLQIEMLEWVLDEPTSQYHWK